jgi:hypothetical protein
MKPPCSRPGAKRKPSKCRSGGSSRQSPLGQRAAQPQNRRQGKTPDRLPRSRACRRPASPEGNRTAAQGHDHPARHRLSRGNHVPTREGQLHTEPRQASRRAGRYHGRPLCRGIIFGEITNGAAQDIKHSTEIARMMVCSWGMSDELGPQRFGQNQEVMFLGREVSRQQDYSELRPEDRRRGRAPAARGP